MSLPVSKHQQKHLSDQPRPNPKKILSYPRLNTVTMPSGTDPEAQNEMNYLAWKQEHAQRKRELRTQFNIWRNHQNERMCNHQLFKSESEEHSQELKEIVEKRLSSACSCNTCRVQEHQVHSSADNKNNFLVEQSTSVPHTPS